MNNQISSWLVLPDLHIPEHDERSLKAVLTYAGNHKWDGVLQIGDAMDHSSISRHVKDNIRAIEGQFMRRDYDVGNEVFDRIETATPGAKRVMIEGNHDFRPENVIDKLPQFKGMIETDIGLNLKKRGWRYVRFWRDGTLYKIGNAYFGHGRAVNQWHAKTMVDQYGVPIFYGHTHDVMSVPKVLAGNDKTIVGQSLGCLCKYAQKYLKGRPTKWQQAFATFHFMPNGYFSYYVTKIFNHTFVGPDGVKYSA